MPETEATARIKINRFLEAAGWRFFPENGKANRELITRFEQKIQTTLARVWGEEGKDEGGGMKDEGESPEAPELMVAETAKGYAKPSESR